MTSTKPLETQLYIVENFKLDGKLNVDGLELKLIVFRTENKRLNDKFVTFNIAGCIYLNDNNDSKKSHIVAGFSSYIDVPETLLYNNDVTLTSEAFDIKFHNICPDEIKRLIQQHLTLKITHK